jgi:hypothetical protein
MSRLTAVFTSLKLTVGCLALAMILHVAGTMAQVNEGILTAQKTYFRSFFLYWTPSGTSIAIPFFPGGALLGTLLTINLIATFSTRSIRRKAPLMLLHAGVLALVLSEMTAALLARESQLPLLVGEAKNFSESRDHVELVIADLSSNEYSEVVALPQGMLRAGKTVPLAPLSFTVRTLHWLPHAELSMATEQQPAGPFTISRGVGQNIVVQERHTVSRDDQINMPAAVIEIGANGEKLGTWLVSNALAKEQQFHHNGKEYSIHLQNKRHYYPFSLRLLEFRREVHPGTNIPKSFSSLVKLYDEKGDPERDVLISMNHPLRHGGKTFYQASYGEGDDLSIFQVVDNPASTLPYIASGLVACGLLAHFGLALQRSRGGKNKP